MNSRPFGKFALFLVLVIGFETGVLQALAQDDVTILGNYNIRRDKITVSGFSSGSAMATEFHMAHSSLFSGVGLFSMAYYRCGNGNLIEFGLGCCTFLTREFPFLFPDGSFPRYNVRRAVNDTIRYNSTDLIDPIESLANQKVFIWTGRYDDLIPHDVAVQNKDFYMNFVPEENIMVTVQDAGHDFPTDNRGYNCTKPRPPTTDAQLLDSIINPRFVNCNFSGSYEMLRFLVGDEIVKPTEDVVIGEPQLFSQSDFYYGVNISQISMGEVGWVYIPEYCKNLENECLLHIFFHGCGGYGVQGSRRMVTEAGFLHLAEANHVIMIFPLSQQSYVSLNGCWDFFAHTGPRYATKEGQQIRILHRILQRVLTTVEAATEGGNGLQVMPSFFLMVLVLTSLLYFVSVSISTY